VTCENDQPAEFARRYSAVRRILLILSLTLFVACPVASGLHGAEPADMKSPAKFTGTGQKGAEMSLHQYYQQYLNPYLAGLQVKGRSTDLERNSGVAAKASSGAGGLPSGKAKSPDGETRQDTPSTEQKTGRDGDEKTFVTLNKNDSIGLAEINKRFPHEFRKEYEAELLVGYRVSPLVDILFGKAQKFERSQDSPWGMHDSGWRLKLQKNF
jgi:hypothetical protein